MPRHPKIYAATAQAAEAHPFVLLDGTVEAAQSYADAITTSDWWKGHCKPLFNGTVPLRVAIQQTDLPGYGAGTLRGDREVPLILFGEGPVNGEVPPLADAWVVLHELAHVWEYETFHDKGFLYAFAMLVHRFLGIKHYESLVQSMKDHKIRLNYGRILNG